MRVVTQEGKNSPNPELVNPFALYVAYAPTRDLPTTFLYCYPATVLEWNSGHVIVLPPVAKLEPLIAHRSRPQDMSNDGTLPLFWESGFDIGQMRHPLPAWPDYQNSREFNQQELLVLAIMSLFSAFWTLSNRPSAALRLDLSVD